MTFQFYRLYILNFLSSRFLILFPFFFSCFKLSTIPPPTITSYRSLLSFIILCLILFESTWKLTFHLRQIYIKQFCLHTKHCLYNKHEEFNILISVLLAVESIHIPFLVKLLLICKYMSFIDPIRPLLNPYTRCLFERSEKSSVEILAYLTPVVYY
jgi:hypothetical protein